MALDASSGTNDGTLTSTNASSSLTLGGGGTFQGNQAGERGGALYVTRDSVVVWDR